jgi:phage terminase large subunit-like protein
LQSIAKDHAAIAAQWAARVLSGEEKVGRLLRLAVQRQAKDLQRQEGEGFPYVFNATEGAKVCRWVELLPHVKGPKRGENIYLEPWQCWLLTTGYGWVRKDTGHRRFRRFSWWMTRGTGKTLLGAALGLYELRAGQGAEAVFGATTEKQAYKAFNPARSMLLQRKEIKQRLGLEVGKAAIKQDSSDSTLEPISSDAGGQEGGNYQFALLDELHAHPTRELYDTILTGCGKRPTSLFCVISTAPTDTVGIGHEEWAYAKSVLEGMADDDGLFAIIIAADEKADPWSEETWKQANPGWGISIDPGHIRALAKKAQKLASQRPGFFTRHLGWVVENGTPFIDAAAWDAAADTTLKIEDFVGKPCYVGVDLASTRDLCGVAYIFPTLLESGRIRYNVFGRTYTNMEAVEEAGNNLYPGWMEAGNLKVHEGRITDHDLIEADLLEDSKRFDIKAVGIDPAQANIFVGHLQAEGITVAEVRTTAFEMHDPLTKWDAGVEKGEIIHDGNPALRWQMCNVIVMEGQGGRLYPTKAKAANKIDTAIACFNAWKLAQGQNPADLSADSIMYWGKEEDDD